ncbi:MAG: hydroxymethylglutaryl-CoA lyase [Myxococcales bacterium]|nr:hydroxymethylglutaryl-CoA lyase [Myxococcales bacterium]
MASGLCHHDAVTDEVRTDDFVSIYEVGLRDGLQNERGFIATEDKLVLLEALLDAGLRRLELTSFVSPKWVPQLADAEEFARRALPSRSGTTLSALVPNDTGLERALGAGLPEIAVFLSASETHNRKNTHKSIDRSFEVFAELVPVALAAGVRVRGYVSTVWGCPYEGPIAPERCVAIAERLLLLGCYQVSLGDTIGVGDPKQTRDIVGRMLAVVPREKIALHLHDTRGTALANILAALELGIREFDASVGGMGGCPYAPGAAGNVATEDLAYMLERMGLETGVDLERIIAAANVAERIVARPLPGRLHRAGPFKPRAAS